MKSPMRWMLVVAASAIYLVTSAPLLALSSPADDRGFKADQVYEFGNVENVNLFNGNLTLVVPIGRKYPAGSNLTFQMKLVYNSHLWDYENRFAPANSSPFEHDPFGWYDSQGNYYDWSALADVTSTSEADTIESVPARQSNAGVGWRLSLGDLKDSATFVDSDGAEHLFGPGLQGGSILPNASIPDAYLASVTYSRDGSYLRMRRVATPDNGQFEPNPSLDPGDPAQPRRLLRYVDKPDGTTYAFACTAGCNTRDTTREKFQLESITNAMHDTVTIARPYPEPTSGSWTWSVLASHGSESLVTHQVLWKLNTLGPDGKPLAPYKWIIDAVQTAGPGGVNALYDFHYLVRGVDLDPNNNLIPGLDRDRNNGTSVTTQVQLNSPRLIVPLLSSIEVFPDATSTGGAGVWSFAYYGHPDEQTLSGEFPTSLVDGHLQSLTLPTGGGYQYEYQEYFFPRTSCQDSDRCRNNGYQGTGLKKKWQVEFDGSLVGPWRYLPTNDPAGVGVNACRLCETSISFRNTVVDPLGNTEIHYFDVNLNDNDRKVFYGLPFTEKILDPSTPATSTGPKRYLSSQTFKCSLAAFADTVPTATLRSNAMDPSHAVNPDGSLACGAASQTQGYPFRDVYVRYEANPYSDCTFDVMQTACAQANRRLASTKIDFHSVSISGTDFAHPVAQAAIDSWKAVDCSDFDGLGNFRSTTTSGNLYEATFPNAPSGRASGNSRTKYTRFNRSGIFSFGVGDGYTGPNPFSTWNLGNYDIQTVSETIPASLSNSSAGTVFDFETNTGFMRSKRVLATAPAGTLPSDVSTLYSNADVLTKFERSPAPGAQPPDNGVVYVTEKHSGGDLSAASGDPEYVMLKTYESGTLAESDFYDCTGSLLLTKEVNSVDPTTGLVLSSADSGGAIQGFSFDGLGRLTSATPPGQTATSYSYFPPAPLGNCATRKSDCAARVTITRSGAHDSVQSEVRYDGLGRVAIERVKLPGVEKWSAKHTTYYPQGWPQLVSTVVDDAGADKNRNEIIGAATNYVAYDPYGRPLEVRNPEGASHKSVYLYSGERQTENRVYGLALAGSDISATTFSAFDTQGRLMRFVDGAGTTADYQYHLLGNLAWVSLGGGAQPNRTFLYDNRGFLTGETAPETGTITVQHCRYDSLGNVGKTTYSGGKCANVSATPSPLDVAYHYDRAARLKLVDHPYVDGTGAVKSRPIKSFTYFTPATPLLPPLSLGKLLSTTRNNHVPSSSNPSSWTDVGVTNTFAYDPSNGFISSKLVEAPDSGFAKSVSYSYDDFGHVSQARYAANCGSTIDPCRNPSSTFTEGLLTGVDLPQVSSQFSYHPNGLWKTSTTTASGRVSSDNQTVAIDGTRRPASLEADFPDGGTWKENSIAYDAQGNVSGRTDAYGRADSFTYDKVGRLISGTTNGQTFSFAYDNFGNVTNLLGTVDSTTNRMKQAGVAYDVGGNLTALPDARPSSPAGAAPISYDYDALGALIRTAGYGFGRTYLYDAEDQRVAVVDYEAHDATGNPISRETWSLRGPSNEILRDYQNERAMSGTSKWSWKEDYLYRGRSVLGAIVTGTNSEAYRIFHLDHLGSPRAVTTIDPGAPPATQVVTDTRDYLPFGAEIMARPNPDRIAFGGNERDDDGTLRPFADIDYVRARYYSPAFGRFLALDRANASQDDTQGWNRYSYAKNNPLSRIDPSGLADAPAAAKSVVYIIGENYPERLKPLQEDLMKLYGSRGGNYGFNPLVETASDTEAAAGQYKSLAQHLSFGGRAIDAGLDPKRTAEVGKEMKAEYDAMRNFHQLVDQGVKQGKEMFDKMMDMWRSAGTKAEAVAEEGLKDWKAAGEAAIKASESVESLAGETPLVGELIEEALESGIIPP